MKMTALFTFACFIAVYVLIDWQALRRTDPVSRGLAIGLYTAALLIWAYRMSALPIFYPGAVIDQWLEPLVPFPESPRVGGTN